MTVPLGTLGQPDFDQPIDLMMDCHRRVEHFVQVLLKVARQGNGQTLTAEWRNALETALNYFQQAAPRHTEDEEDSLFPRLRQSDDPQAAEVLSKMARLEADHQQSGPIHDRVDQLGRQWLEADQLAEQETADLIRCCEQLQQMYQQHIHVEDHEVFPVAQRILSPDALQAIGQEMKARRQHNPGRPTSRCAQRRRQWADSPDETPTTK